MKMNWTPGPARCRSPEYEAEILATDMGGEFPLLVRYRKRGVAAWSYCSFTAYGRHHPARETPYDLMPPAITREALAEEVLERSGASRTPRAKEQALELVAHVIDAVKAGRVE